MENNCCRIFCGSIWAKHKKDQELLFDRIRYKYIGLELYEIWGWVRIVTNKDLCKITE